MFAEPDRFAIARPAVNTHLMFGHGFPYCADATLARQGCTDFGI